jgi:hypothetical protein
MRLDTPSSRTTSERFAAFARATPIALTTFYMVKFVIICDVALKIAIILT